MRLFSTPPLSIVDCPADNNHKSTNRLDYEVIWLHHTGGTDSRQWLSKTSNPPVSCHRLVQRGTIYKIVPDNEVAWTQGFTCFDSIHGHEIDPNRVSLSIEIENMGNGEAYTETDLGLIADQCIEWIGAYGMLPILYHMHCDYRKTDPYGFPKDTFDRLMMERYKRYL